MSIRRLKPYLFALICTIVWCILSFALFSKPMQGTAFASVPSPTSPFVLNIQASDHIRAQSTPPAERFVDQQGVSSATKQSIQTAIQRAVSGGSIPDKYYFLASWTEKEGWAIGTVLEHSYSGGDENFLVASYFDGKTRQTLTQYDAKFEEFLYQSPESFMPRQSIPMLTREKIDPSIIPQGISITMRFPWQDGQAWRMGSYGLHDDDNGPIKYAFDFIPHPDIAASDRKVIAAAQGVVFRRCQLSTSAQQDILWIRHYDNSGTEASMYIHLDRSTTSHITIGSIIPKGHYLGSIIPNIPQDGCGRGNPAHVHFGVGTIGSGVTFVKTSMAGSVIDGWTVGSDSCLRKGNETRCIGAYFTPSQGGGTCGAPSLNSPSDGFVSNTQTITFTWSALSGCSASGYTFRIKNVNNMDSGGTTIFDTGEGGLSRTETIGSNWNNQDLYWGVKSAASGAPWSVRRFRITPGTGGQSCPNNADQIALFVDPDYNANGGCKILNIGDYKDPGAMQFANDAASSIRVGANVKAILYENGDFNGNSETFQGDDSNLSDNSIGDNKVSSVKVQLRNSGGGNVQLCREDNGNNCRTFPLGAVDLSGDGDNDQFRSVRVSGGWSVWVFRENRFEGQGDCYTGNRFPLPSGGDYDLYRQITSIQSFDYNACRDQGNPVAQMKFAVLARNGNDGTGHFFGLGNRDGLVDLSNTSFNDRGNAIMLPNGWSARLYAGGGGNPEGEQTPCVSGMVLNLGQFGLTDKLSSVDLFLSPGCPGRNPSPPLLASPNNNATTSNGAVNFRWESPNAINQRGYTLRIGSSSNPASGTWLVDEILDNNTLSRSYTFANSGVYYWHVNTRIFNAESAWVSRQITIDTVKPTVSMLWPLANANINNNQLPIQASASDALSGVYQVQFFVGYIDAPGYWVDLGVDTDGSNGWSITWNGSAIADQEIGTFAYAFDRAGNIEGTSVGGIKLDRTLPSSSVSALPATTATTSFTVNWAGSDNLSGVEAYEIQYQENGGAWVDWTLTYGTTSATFTGTAGRTYGFRSRAYDRAGNIESWPATADTTTTIVQATNTSTPVPTRADTIGLYKDGVFYLRHSNTAGPAEITSGFGGDSSDRPVVGDWNGNGVDTIGVYRSGTGFFFLSDSNTAPTINYQVLLGNPNDTPFAGKWRADMVGDGIGVFRPSNGILYQKRQLTSGFSDYFAVFGNPGDVGIAGDWDANGLDSIGVYRPSNTTWYMTNNSEPSGITFGDIGFVWNVGSGIPLVGDWNGDRTSTVGYRAGTTFVLHSTNAAPGSDISFAFGVTGGYPIAGKWTSASAPNPSVLVQATQRSGYSNNGGDGAD
jgi:hypothetical protein